MLLCEICYNKCICSLAGGFNDALENKLGITDSVELARAEEKISKQKALELFELNLLDTFEVGTFRAYQAYTNIYLTKYMISQDNCEP